MIHASFIELATKFSPAAVHFLIFACSPVALGLSLVSQIQIVPGLVHTSVYACVFQLTT